VVSASPRRKITGRNTTTVVSVEATTGATTSVVPTRAAAFPTRPSSRCRKMFSNTTIEVSTSMPMPSARAPSVIRLRE